MHCLHFLDEQLDVDSARLNFVSKLHLVAKLVNMLFFLFFSNDQDNFFIDVIYFLHTMDYCFCKKTAKPNTLPGGLGVQWWLISIMFTFSLNNFNPEFMTTR